MGMAGTTQLHNNGTYPHNLFRCQFRRLTARLLICLPWIPLCDTAGGRPYMPSQSTNSCLGKPQPVAKSHSTQRAGTHLVHACHCQLCEHCADLAVLTAAADPVLGGLIVGCVDHKLTGCWVIYSLHGHGHSTQVFAQLSMCCAMATAVHAHCAVIR